MAEHTPGGAPIFHSKMRDHFPKLTCPVCAKDRALTRRQRSRAFTWEGLACHMESKHRSMND